LTTSIKAASNQSARVAYDPATLVAAGVRQVWAADPEFRTVTVHRPDGSEPMFFTESEEIIGDPDLDGFRCRVGRLFGAV
jgi:hypothetical protein